MNEFQHFNPWYDRKITIVRKPNGFSDYYDSTIYQQENIVVLYFKMMDYYDFIPTFMFVD